MVTLVIIKNSVKLEVVGKYKQVFLMVSEIMY